MSKKRIFVIFTGGTICTLIKNGVMDTDNKATSALIDFYKKSNSFCKDEIDFTEGESFHILSENMTVDCWNKLTLYFLNNIEKLREYDGIIIAHGTDTLAYSTSLFSVLLKGFEIPVIFVSSNFSIMNEDGSENSQANGNINFKAAVECIYKGICSGVYATYKNPNDRRIYLHNGSHLIQCTIYDENFYSRDPLNITSLDKLNLKDLWWREKDNKNNMLILKLKDKALENCILKINPYVGLNYDLYNLEKVKAVLHGVYHSGTSCVVKNHKDAEYDNSSVLYFFDKCAELNIPFYYSPSLTGDGCNVYASVPYIKNHTANGQKPIILYGDTEELVYAKLLVKYSLGIEDLI